jgi:hypothetical protein
MTDFLVLFRFAPQGPPTSAEMERWGKWVTVLQKKGALKNPGHPVEFTGAVLSGRDVVEGVLDEDGTAIGGYMILEAKTLKAAIKLVSGCPILQGDGMVEVRPLGAM